MNTYHAALWSDPSSTSECRYRNTHHQRTKQRGNGQEQERQRYLENWTWEEILDGKGPWAQPGEYCRPKAELEAAKAERRRYEKAAWQRGWKPERQPQIFWGGRYTRSVAKSSRRPEPTPHAYRRARGTGQAPCYAVERMVSPVRVHSPVRYIPGPRIGRDRVGIEPGAMKPALRIWSPVHLLGPAYMAPALRMVSQVRQHSPVRAIPPRLTGLATGSIQPGKVGQARCSRAPVHLHGPVYPVPPPRTSPPVVAPPAPSCLSIFSLQVLPPVQRCQSLPPAQRCQTLPSVLSRQSLPSVLSCQSLPSVLSRQSLPSVLSRKSLPSVLSRQSLPSVLSRQSLLSVLSRQSRPSFLSRQSRQSVLSRQSARSHQSSQSARSRQSCQPARSRQSRQPARSRQEPPEPSASQEPPELSVSQAMPEFPFTPELPESPACPPLPESPVHSGPVARVPSPRSAARVAAHKRPRGRLRRRTTTMVKWGPRPAPEPPPRTDAHPDPPL
ncbi:proline-rich protein 36-like isoform X1 [Oncorhynchus keta]|uniref:proline-rich protein 36-like isoform X1 n=1 Tax=Oncorhynchus keta TaxID=8018 RepID=UPI00227D4D12|nr:proline-rich protein 36-like isoform X1 [Oncorhynchus keta]XP_052314143.1 proline-rich protein 36-like isoform X1 [Oncorhynchus keta]